MLLLVTACALPGSLRPGTSPDVAPTATTATTPAATATPAPPAYWIDPLVPAATANRLKAVLDGAGYSVAQAPEQAQVRVIFNPPQDAILTARIVYVVAAPFPTIPDDISTDALKTLWSSTGGAPTGFNTAPALFVTPQDASILAPVLGAAGPSVIQADAPTLLDRAWQSRPALALIPFDHLLPRWKVLTLDGRSPLDKSLDMSSYPLTATLGVVASPDARARALELLSPGWEQTNRDPAFISTVVMTGTTALTRATAWMMDHRGVNFPAEKIMPFFSDADILHVSNEVSFTPKCPPAELTGDEKFCSDPKYLELLKTIGIDIVELTGNHNLDYGVNPALYSLDRYDENHIPHFGGGRDLADAETPRILTTPDGTRIAFLGCNSAGPFKAWATPKTPGAAPCGDWGWIKAAIADLKASRQADLVIVTLQYHESPSYIPEPKQVTDFEALAAAGADIVSGSQAHQPQGFSFASGKFIHFGVGNLFFDYTDNLQMFADKYVLYKGRLISVVLFTGMIEDYSQPRPMTSKERAAFLKTIFAVSGW